MSKIATCAAAIAALIGAPAFSADMAVKMPVKAPPPAPAPVFSWTGFYVGVHGGGAWFAKDWFFPCTTTNAVFGPPCDVSENGHTGSGWLAGGQVGFNYQISQWVWGVESQFSATRIEGSNASPFFSPEELHSRTDFIGTIVGRFGVSWDRTLFYAKGGGAWVNDHYWVTHPDVGTFVAADETRWGWMVGAGIEYAFAANWSAKVEYDYLGLGTRRLLLVGTIPGQPPFDEDIRQSIQLVKVGVNYKFDWGGVPAAVSAKY